MNADLFIVKVCTHQIELACAFIETVKLFILVLLIFISWELNLVTSVLVLIVFLIFKSILLIKYLNILFISRLSSKVCHLLLSEFAFESQNIIRWPRSGTNSLIINYRLTLKLVYCSLKILFKFRYCSCILLCRHCFKVLRLTL